MSNPSSPWEGSVAIVLVVACCALVPILVASGLISAAAGVAARYWPLTVVGIALLAWAGVRIARVVRRRREALRKPEAGELAGSDEQR